jgi:hypothetical protein
MYTKLSEMAIYAIFTRIINLSMSLNVGHKNHVWEFGDSLESLMSNIITYHMFMDISCGEQTNNGYMANKIRVFSRPDPSMDHGVLFLINPVDSI